MAFIVETGAHHPGIKPDVFYSLGADAKPFEVA